MHEIQRPENMLKISVDNNNKQGFLFSKTYPGMPRTPRAYDSLSAGTMEVSTLNSFPSVAIASLQMA